MRRFLIEEQPDGNWIGKAIVVSEIGAETLVGSEVRDVGPETVLQLLLTQDGQ